MIYLKTFNESKKEPTVLESVDDFHKFLETPSVYTLEYKGYDFQIESNESEFYEDGRVEHIYITLLIDGEVVERELNVEITTLEYDEDILFLFEEILNRLIDYYKEGIKAEKKYKEKIKKGYIEISPNDMKKILIEVIPGYIGKKHQALSGSEYILVNNKELRISDHERPYDSKWNLIHGDYTNIKSGMLSYEDVKKYIEHLINRPLDNYQGAKLKKFFNI